MNTWKITQYNYYYFSKFTKYSKSFQYYTSGKFTLRCLFAHIILCTSYWQLVWINIQSLLIDDTVYLSGELASCWSGKNKVIGRPFNPDLMCLFFYNAPPTCQLEKEYCPTKVFLHRLCQQLFCLSLLLYEWSGTF